MPMDLQKIELLIEKYLEAQTSLEEEKLLKSFFSKPNIPSHLLVYRDMFTFFTTEELLDYQASSPSVTKKVKKAKINWTHAAAVAVLMVSTFFPARQYYQEQQAKIAYKETLKAFAILANNYQKATASVGYLNEFEIAKNKIYTTKKP
jgi:hypothetical protein